MLETDNFVVRPEGKESVLRTDRLVKRYGKRTVANGVSINVRQGEIVGLLGPNGAGKTTAFNLFTGVYQPTTGEILFKDKSIVGLAPYQITERGIARTFQNIRLFGELTVLDNVKIAYHCHMNYGFIEAVLRVGRYWEEERKLEEEAYRLLEIFHLADTAQEKAKNLPYGAQRRLEIARALAAQPALLLLDEPSMGLAPLLIKEIFSIIVDINKTGTTVLLVEQNANMALSIANRAYVLETGRITLSGDAKELAASEDVRKAYLGG